MIIIRAIALLLFFTIIPIAVGRLITYKARTGFIADYLVGFFGNLAIFYVIYSVVEWLQIWYTTEEVVTGGFTFLLKVYFIVISVLLVLWIWLDRKAIRDFLKIVKQFLSSVVSQFKSDKLLAVYGLLFAILLLGQLYMAYAYELNQWSYDDYDYVVTSKDTISSNTLTYVNFIDGTMPNVTEKRAVASWGTYVAMLSFVSDFEVTTVYHTILPVVLLLIAYLTFYYIAKFLFKELDNRLIFMIILSMVHIFGLYSHYSITFRLLGAIWQGKAVLSAIAVPFLALYLINAYNDELTNKKMLSIIAISLGASSFTSLATMFIPIVAGLVFIIMCIYNKRIYGIRYLLASLIGPLYQVIFYAFVWMIQQDMQNQDFKYIKFRDYSDGWKAWFH